LGDLKMNKICSLCNGNHYIRNKDNSTRICPRCVTSSGAKEISDSISLEKLESYTNTKNGKAYPISHGGKL